MAQKFCTGCGREIDAAAKACPFCGQAQAAVKGKKSPVALIIIIAVVVCLAAAAAVGVILLKKTGAETTAAAETGSGSGVEALMDALLVAAESEAAEAAEDTDGPATLVPNAKPQLPGGAEVGDVVTFGHYYSSADGSEYAPIEWIVLARDGKNALLLSRYGLDMQPYNEEYAGALWEDCTLRSWLNGEFMTVAFSKAERKAILTTEVSNDSGQCSPEYDTEGGADTQDKVFLLSWAEADAYLGGVPFDSFCDESRAAVTAYAQARGVEVAENRQTTDGEPAGKWWLRSPGRQKGYAAQVYTGGYLTDAYVNETGAAVRPAMWVKMG